MFTGKKIQELDNDIIELLQRVRILETFLPIIIKRTSMGPYKKLKLQDEIDQILEHLGLEYQERCREELPRLNTTNRVETNLPKKKVS